MNQVGIVMCYRIGTRPMLGATLRILERYKPDIDVKLYLAYRDTGEFDADEDLGVLTLPFEKIELPGKTYQRSPSRIHGEMLDRVIPDVDAEYVLTLDSDCFPVANDWLIDLMQMQDDACRCSGILHPWSPPKAGLDTSSIEYRVRLQHCWYNTHVACQLVKKDFLKDLKVSYLGGDDTGLLIPLRTRQLGYDVRGYMPTCGPLPDPTSSANPEFNRYLSIVYGDKMYHHGQYTSEHVHQEDHYGSDSFGVARKRVINECGAEFLLDDDTSHRFVFDREDDVMAMKLKHMFGLQRSPHEVD